MKKGLFALLFALVGLTACNSNPGEPSIPFVPDEYDLKFDYNFPDCPAPVTGKCIEGELISVTPPEMPVREDWTALNTWSLSPSGSFFTWDFANRRVHDEDAINGTLTLYAMWDMNIKPEPPEPVTELMDITLNLNGLWNTQGEEMAYAAWSWSETSSGRWDILDKKDENIYVLPDFDYLNRNVLFAAFYVSSVRPNWDDVVYQTVDLKVPAKEYSEFKVKYAGSGGTDKATGAWINPETGEEAPIEPPTPGETATLYLNLNGTSNWQKDGASFALWAWPTGGQGSWKFMNKVNDNIWKIENFEFTSYGFLFVSYPSSSAAPDWSTVYHQTNDLTVTDTSKNCYKITSPGSGTSLKASGVWETYQEA